MVLLEHARPFQDEVTVPEKDIIVEKKWLLEKVGCSDNDLMDQLDFLQDQKEIYIDWELEDMRILGSGQGTIAATTKKYILLGRKEFYDQLNDVVKNFGTIILVLIAFITFLINIYKTQENKKDIENIKQEIQKMKASKN